MVLFLSDGHWGHRERVFLAQELIQRVGVNAMSYKDISEAIGIRKASIHYYFPSKDDLLSALLDRYNDCFLRLVDGIIAQAESAEVKLRRYCSLFAATLSSGKGDKACLYGAEWESGLLCCLLI